MFSISAACSGIQGVIKHLHNQERELNLSHLSLEGPGLIICFQDIEKWEITGVLTSFCVAREGDCRIVRWVRPLHSQTQYLLTVIAPYTRRLWVEDFMFLWLGTFKILP